MKLLLLIIAIITGGYTAYVSDNQSQRHEAPDTSYAVALKPSYQSTEDRIRVFLEKKKSPLVPYAKDFVKEAEAYRIDPSIVLGISGAESSWGKRYISRTNNFLGWGYCDSCADGTHFTDIPEAIGHVTKKIATGKYYRKFQATKDCKDLAKVYLTGDRERWCSVIEATRKGIAQ